MKFPTIKIVPNKNNHNFRNFGIVVADIILGLLLLGLLAIFLSILIFFRVGIAQVGINGQLGIYTSIF
jgi:hypothetical protein